MHLPSTTLTLLLTLLTSPLTLVLALPTFPPFASITIRAPSPANTNINPDAVLSTTCTDPSIALDSHDTNVAILSICGGIAGAIEKCGGNPKSTVGASGTSKFTLTPVNGGETINVSKGRWEGCVRAAQAVCPTGTYKSMCVGGTSDGVGFVFELSAN